MAVCDFEGNSDMYGLGIRLGYYFQWFGAILAAWIAPSEVQGLRFGIDLFVAATFLALVIATGNDVNSLEPVDTYIILLLMFGAYLALVPIFLWRLLTGCDPYWDPTRYPLVKPGSRSANLNFLMLIGALVFQYWFWFDRVPDLDDYNCQQYGFLLAQVRLNSKVSVVLNILMYFWLGIVCLYIIVLKIRHAVGFPDPSERRKRLISRRHKREHIRRLQNMDTWSKLIVVATVTAAVELTISWNEIDGANTLSGAGQTIPFVIGLGALIRILYVYFFYAEDQGSDSGSYYGSGGAHPYRGPPSPLPYWQMPTLRYGTPQHFGHRRARSGPRPSATPEPIPVRQMPRPGGPPMRMPVRQMPVFDRETPRRS
ncbi:hypothetical protein BU26DRAFT_607578 [Trematosphaeria pertusa]|uniref:Uncharacterized protein n=1 Tax=Trematosphaeria pertusa TaxID=390896 RepID=A0A6A6I6Z1_9PLEO|nr:uncharacterized protein BU26DRAFT_607578 [Trematosphaeria pertusa]KAF2245280.1 hypothetical protein BU26DRAFT_607578 [Trematosphaeria pertusa]